MPKASLVLAVIAASLLFLAGAVPAAALDLPRPAPLRERDGIALAEKSRNEPADILAAAASKAPDVLRQYHDYMERMARDPENRDRTPGDLFQPVTQAQKRALENLETTHRFVERAFRYARTSLGNPDYEEEGFDRILEELEGSLGGTPGLRKQASGLVASARKEANTLQELRADVFDQLIDESTRGTAQPGTLAAWSLMRLGIGMPDAMLDPGGFHFDQRTAAADITIDGRKVEFHLAPENRGKRVRATVDSYTFSVGWALLLQKPLHWMLSQARAMRQAGVGPDAAGEWFLMEAPGGLVAVSGQETETPRVAFFQGRLYGVVELPEPERAASLNEAFLNAAQQLHEGIMADEGIPQSLRQALHPVLEGTYRPVDRRDYFDNEFCRRLIEADYLEAHIHPLPPERARELAYYRKALANLEAGIDRFAIPLEDGSRLVAVVKTDPKPSADGAAALTEAGETAPAYEWRLEEAGSTSFHSPLPERQLYALSLVERYDGLHASRPKGVARATEVWHPVLGRIASYRDGDPAAEGSEKAWLEAVTMDCRGRLDQTSGPLGWNFPFHVLQRDDQGDPVRLATLRGVVDSPSFPDRADAEALLRAEDAWLDQAATVLAEPGELGLIFHHFFRYCSDSPLPELPNLIGSHYGLSDTHQTVYQSLERRWVGRLIGDCDDLAEFFQVLTARQGKLSHVMQLPAHAAAGYVDRTKDGGYLFVVLQTGPVLQFPGDTLYEAVEKAYRSFDTEQGTTAITPAAVPLLLRFADEDTRTAFVLPARIYEDRDYAEAMIDVQEYWHLHAFSAAIAIMEDMIATDDSVGNLRELASLYEQVGNYREAESLRGRELAAAGADPEARIATLLEIAHLQVKSKNRTAAADTLRQAGELFSGLREEDRDGYSRVNPLLGYWVLLQAQYGDPVQAWEILRPDIRDIMAGVGRPPEYLQNTLVVVYDRLVMRLEKVEAGKDAQGERARGEMEEVLDITFGQGYFSANDSYNRILARYARLGRYAVALEGRAKGLALLAWNGPFPSGKRDHAARRRPVSGEDWEWFRITPNLFLAYGLEMLDNDDAPELYDPAVARTMLGAVPRAAGKGRGLGSDVVGAEAIVKADLVLSFLGNDREGFTRVMGQVLDKNYSSLYDDAAQVFGNHCGWIPIDEFPDWLKAFRRHFPGRQHYFKAAYRALDKEFFDHAQLIAEAAAAAFPEDSLMREEARYLATIIPSLRARHSQGATPLNSPPGTIIIKNESEKLRLESHPDYGR